MKATSKPAKPSSFQSLEIKTSWGPITLTLDGDCAVECTLPFLEKMPRKPFSIEPSSESEIIVPFFPNLGRKPVPQRSCFPNIGKPQGTEFQRAVWREMQKIPRGQTRTYGEIAKAIGRSNAVRAVGSACGANPLPLFIPCHRVVAKNGPGGFGSGLPWKMLLLKLEGCAVDLMR